VNLAAGAEGPGEFLPKLGGGDVHACARR
jgi:hypothetical protein